MKDDFSLPVDIERQKRIIFKSDSVKNGAVSRESTPTFRSYWGRKKGSREGGGELEGHVV